MKSCGVVGLLWTIQLSLRWQNWTGQAPTNEVEPMKSSSSMTPASPVGRSRWHLLLAVPLALLMVLGAPYLATAAFTATTSATLSVGTYKIPAPTAMMTGTPSCTNNKGAKVGPLPSASWSAVDRATGYIVTLTCAWRSAVPDNDPWREQLCRDHLRPGRQRQRQRQRERYLYAQHQGDHQLVGRRPAGQNVHLLITAHPPTPPRLDPTAPESGRTAADPAGAPGSQRRNGRGSRQR